MASDETRPIQVAGREVGQFGPIPTIRDMGQDALAEDVERFISALVTHCESLRQACRDKCLEDHFEERLERDRRRAIGELKLSIDPITNKVIANQDDGYAFYGLTLGLTCQGTRSANAFLLRKLLLQTQRPYALKMRGDRAENRKMEKLLYAVLDDLLKRGGFHACLEMLCNLLPRQPLTVLRYEMGAEPQYVRSKDDTWEEKPPDLAPSFQVWPIDQMYVSNVQTPFAKDQESVFWMTPEATLSTLQQDEALYLAEIDPETGKETGKKTRVSGKFQNLEALRDEAATNARGNSSDEGSIVTPFLRYTLVEMEGALPAQYWAEQKILTPEVAAWFGADVGFVPDMEDEEDRSEWARRVGRITHWQVAYIAKSETGRSTGALANHVLRCEPDLSKRARNSLFAFRFFLNGFEWYGRSLADLGQSTEKAADLVLNSKVFAEHKNSDPPLAIDLSAFKSKSLAAVQAFLSTPGEAVETLAMRDMKSAVVPMLAEEPADALRVLDLLTRTYQDQTGVRGASWAADETGTLGEIQMDQSKNSAELDVVLHLAYSEIGRMLTCLVEDFFHYMPEEAILAYCERVSGMARSEIEELLPSLDGIEREVEFLSPLNASNDAAVLTTLLLKILEMLPDAFPDRVGLAKALMEINGYARGADLTADSETMKPEDEHAQMRAGNLVEPDPSDDFLDHIAKHEAELQALAKRMAEGQGAEPNPEDANLAALLPAHYEAQITLFQAVQMQAQLMQATAPGAPGGAGGVATREGKTAPGGTGGGPKDAGGVGTAGGPRQTPTSEQQMGSDIRGQARGVVR